MNSEEYLLTFELSKDGGELHVHCNDAGLRLLQRVLSSLASGQMQNDHLMTPQWAGNELSGEQQSDECTLLNKVTVHKW